MVGTTYICVPSPYTISEVETVGLQELSSFSAPHRKTAMEKALYLLILGPSLLDVLLLRLTLNTEIYTTDSVIRGHVATLLRKED